MKKKYFAFGVFILLFGCVEPFEAETMVFESVLIVEATITNEMIQHEILLSRTSPFEEDGPNWESNAIIKITDDAQTDFVFQETEPGRYISNTGFSALPDKNYQLSIITSDGRSYATEPTQLTQATGIDDLYVSRETNSEGIEGVAILVDSFDPSGNAQYYRYEYEETYRIIAPRWDPFDFIVINDVFPDFEVGIIPKTTEQRVCYASVKSNTIIQNTTVGLREDNVARFLLRFIDRDNYIISHRYSILVRQYVQSIDAFNYYETLRNFSVSENIFSQIQPGFFGGNIFSMEDREEKVLGFFEVSSVTSERMFFNYADLFPGEPLPPYAISCGFVGAVSLSSPGGHPMGITTSPLIEAIRANQIKYIGTNPNPLVDGVFAPFLTITRACGDCTALGSNIVPDFWED